MINSYLTIMKKIPFLLVLVIICLSGYSQKTGTVTDPRDGKVYNTIKIGNQWVMAQNLGYKPEKGVFWADTSYFEKDVKVKLTLVSSRTLFEKGKVHFTVKSGFDFDGAIVPKLFNSDATYGILMFDSAKFFRKSLFDGYLVLDSVFFKRFGYLYDFETAKACVIPGWHVPTGDEWKELLKYIGGNAKSQFSALIEGGNSGFDAVLCGWGKFVAGGLKNRSITDCQGSLWSSSKAGHMGVCLDFNGPPVLRPGATRIGLINLGTGLSVRLVKDK
jgi:uncharacterized protein (TIGR02145 family)